MAPPLLAVAATWLAMSQPQGLHISSPALGETVHFHGHRPFNVSLAYDLAGGAQGRAQVCLEMSKCAVCAACDAREPEACAGTFEWFAEGCFDADQPITLVLPAEASDYELRAAAKGPGVLGAPMAHTSFRARRARVFEPSYDWQPVPAGLAIPPGLDVQMSLDAGGSVARIPSPFRLQLTLPAGLGVFRTDVERGTPVGELNGRLWEHVVGRVAKQRGPAATEALEGQCTALAVADDAGQPRPIAPHLTAEQAGLFASQDRMRVEVRPCAAAEGGAWDLGAGEAHGLGAREHPAGAGGWGGRQQAAGGGGLWMPPGGGGGGGAQWPVAVQEEELGATGQHAGLSLDL